MTLNIVAAVMCGLLTILNAVLLVTNWRHFGRGQRSWVLWTVGICLTAAILNAYVIFR
jgi:hypothetical protein